MLSVEGLRAGYSGSLVLQGIDFELDADDCIALVGRNGMGKTTFVRSLLGLVDIYDGRVGFDGADLRRLRTYQIAAMGIGWVPEGRLIFTRLSVEENLAATARRGLWTTSAVYEIFPALAERRHHRGWQLSGGEQQMLAIGRALMTNPRLLVVDEATEGLAPVMAERLWEVFTLLRSRGQSLLIIDRNLDSLARIARRFLVMEKGRIAWNGDIARFQAERPSVEAYLGIAAKSSGA
ncbi:MAG: ABC transporter ATP-binding protein [Betaproteobacteria bacterium RIFCSPLOWO2_12_FULL_63_13]|nr:MAG: ABC transporter ATP-binding protein [Betaproteobacteria bacterium RIFCSPLOWO2_02_FULL_63_19]OGA43352.1 MAG: ABC transporter ATP-binding protein [Betaproteobacteria bacterium RIFCSPLOWO2_12_FULL_63_13]